MVWKLFLWSSLRKSYTICRENSDMAEFWPFKTKILVRPLGAFLTPKIFKIPPKMVIFKSYWILLKISTLSNLMLLILFLLWKLFLWSSLRKSYSVCRENSDMKEFLPFKTKIWPFFGENWQFWEFLTYNFQTPLWIFLIFGMEGVLMVLFEKIIHYMPGKFWYGGILAI